MKGRASLAAICTAFAASHAIAAGTDVQISGAIDNTDPNDGLRHEEFTCTGMPTCTGVHTVTLKPKSCSNTFSFSSDIQFSGFDLSKPGTFTGTMTLPYRMFHTSNPDGTCTWYSAPGTTWPFSASWDGTNGTMDVSATHQDGTPRAEHGLFSANVSSASPVFPITVTATLSTTTASATAQIQPRPQDVGTSAGIFVFAHAPASLVQGAIPPKRVGSAPGVVWREEDDPGVCVLAQMGADGQLVAVSASTMQAYFSGVLSSQATSINILNNVSTPNVAGATFYVGYGADPASMLATGVYESAITIPGSVQCTATLASAPAPNAPGALTGLWWNAAEPGWGIHLTQRRNVVFAAWFTYDGSGNPKWYVASSCAMPAGTTGTAGTCNGTLYEVSGAPFFGAAFDPSLTHTVPAGSLQIDFQDASTATMSYALGGQARTIPITRQVFDAGTTSPAVDYTDLWWNPNEPGWGLAIAHEYGTMFLAWFVYDGNGRPVWYVASDCVVSGSGCSGTLYRATGPAFGPSFDPTQVHVGPSGSVRLNFNDANNGTLTYTVGGASSSKAITRELF